MKKRIVPLAEFKGFFKLEFKENFCRRIEMINNRRISDRGRVLRSSTKSSQVFGSLKPAPLIREFAEEIHAIFHPHNEIL